VKNVQYKTGEQVGHSTTTSWQNHCWVAGKKISVIKHLGKLQERLLGKNVQGCW